MDGLKTKDAIQEKIISQKSIHAGKRLRLVTFSAFKFIIPMQLHYCEDLAIGKKMTWFIDQHMIQSAKSVV